ncbi:MAG: hypothetical protein EP330_11935 [Deltaproteobacteria bacterium]|nr:MAG: hypothetical protein EP330_11935 [Deltaproteobacteria bacterium]
MVLLLLAACGAKKKSADRVVSGVVVHQEREEAPVAPKLEKAPAMLHIERGMLFVNDDVASSWPPSPDELEGSRIVPLAEAVDRALLHKERHAIFKLPVDEGGYGWLGAVVTTLGMTGVTEMTWATDSEAHPLSIPRTRSGELGWMLGLKPTIVLRLRVDETRVWPEARLDFRPQLEGVLSDPTTRPTGSWDPNEAVDCSDIYEPGENFEACNEHVLEAPSVALGGDGCLVEPTDIGEAATAWKGQLQAGLRPWLHQGEHFDAALVAPPGLPLDVLERTLTELSELGADRVFLGGMVAEDERLAEPRCGVGARDLGTVDFMRARALGARNHAERARRPLAYSVGPLDRILQIHMPRIGACYGSSKSVGTPGNLVIQLQLDGDGQASRFAVPSSSFEDPDMHDCILDVFRDITYPAPPSGQTLTLRYPLAFAPN